MTIKENLERLEKEKLSEFAALSCEAKREKEISEDNVRTEFQRDRDRITHSKCFRRLMHKTQVFLSPENDHYRTRLTHTLEVSQIARTIAKALNLNEDLTEAIALGHDIGHTPFGHAGERAISSYLEEEAKKEENGENIFTGRTFRHYEQSVRVAKTIEKLNLTEEVLDGIFCHTDKKAKTLEGRIVRFADVIAYVNHDIDDAVRAEVISEDDISLAIRNAVGHTHGERINYFVLDIIENSKGKNEIIQSDEAADYLADLKKFLKHRVYDAGSPAKTEEGKAEKLVKTLLDYYIKNPDKLYEDCKEAGEEEDIISAAIDYISGMTDRYAIKKYRELFIPNEWQG